LKPAEPISIFVRYIVAGSVAAAAHFGVLWLLVEWFAVYPTLASALGFCVATGINYSLQYHWTFRVTGPHGVIFTRYLLVTIAMLGVNTALFWVLNEFGGIPYLLTQAVATGSVVILNFTINRRYTFVEPHAPPATTSR
jgi:putative flippase GtrA